MKADSGGVLGDIYVNQAELFTSSAPDNPVVSNNPYTQIPGITIVKSANPTTVTAAGQPVTYTFTVANKGKVSVNNVSVTDTQVLPSVAQSLKPITCKALSSPAAPCSGGIVPTLAGGQTATFTAEYTATQADVDNGTITDTAVANGVTNPGGAPITSTPSTAVVTATPSPGISVTKTASPTTVTAIGAPVTYTFVATNTGNVTLTGVGITDDQVAPALNKNLGAISCTTLTSPAGSCSGATTTLAPGQSATFTGVYTVQPADADYGTITDKATAHGTPPGTTAPITSNEAIKVVTIPPAPALTIVKDSATTVVTAANQTIPYTFLVTNTGNVTLGGVHVADTVAPPSSPSSLTDLSCPKATLASGESMTCTANYTTTQPDVDNGRVDDSAVAKGTPPPTLTNPLPLEITSPKSDKSIPVTQSPSIELHKSATYGIGQIGNAGDTINYTVVATNTGNLTLSNVVISDDLKGLTPLTFAWPDPTKPNVLLPGQSVVGTASYTVTQTDVDSEKGVTNHATVTSKAPNGETPHADDTKHLDTPATSGIQLVKTGERATTGTPHPGDLVTYSFAATNLGKVSLTNVTITDPMKGLTPITYGAWPDPTKPGVLTPGQTITGTATYKLTQADIDASKVDNTATTVGDPPVGDPVTSEATYTLVLPSDAKLALHKTGSIADGVWTAGEKVTYGFVVANTGNVTLHGVTVSDPMAGLSVLTYTWPDPQKPGVLAPGETATATATYRLTPADARADTLTNNATASSDRAPSVKDSVTLTGPADPPAIVGTIVGGLAVLAGTGSTISMLPIAGGLILVGGGVLFMLLSRKRRARRD
ncbi:DUF11 domain-containing protein [Leifsonia shinshuensis]|nr:DUF11 domain-containing protein [Leifsonia shinshuensis]